MNKKKKKKWYFFWLSRQNGLKVFAKKLLLKFLYTLFDKTFLYIKQYQQL